MVCRGAAEVQVQGAEVLRCSKKVQWCRGAGAEVLRCRCADVQMCRCADMENGDAEVLRCRRGAEMEVLRSLIGAEGEQCAEELQRCQRGAEVKI